MIINLNNSTYIICDTCIHVHTRVIGIMEVLFMIWSIYNSNLFTLLPSLVRFYNTYIYSLYFDPIESISISCKCMQLYFGDIRSSHLISFYYSMLHNKCQWVSEWVLYYNALIKWINYFQLRHSIVEWYKWLHVIGYMQNLYKNFNFEIFKY